MDIIRRILSTILALVIASAIGYLFDLLGFPDTSIAFVYLLSVLLAVWRSSSLFLGLAASVTATFLFNYFFAAPRFTFTVNDPNYYVTFLTLAMTSIVVSTLTTRSRQKARLAQERETEATSLYMLTNRLSDASSREDIVSIALQAIHEGLACSCGCLCLDDRGQPEPTYVYLSKDEGKSQLRRETEDPKSILYRLKHMTGNPSEGEEFYDWPLYGRDDPLGILRIPQEEAREMDAARLRLLHSMIDSIALALDRFRVAEQRIQSREEASRERYRANLLRSISHDIRTPLAGIIGTSEILAGMLDPTGKPYHLAGEIRTDAEWLHSLVENILNLTRLQDSNVRLKKEWEAVEEIVGGAVGHVEQHWPNQEIEVDLPEEILMAPMDAKLIEQVIINLLENAIKHSGGTPVTLKVAHAPSDEAIIVSVRDRGAGIPMQDLPHIFQPFYTASRQQIGPQRNFGLGLAICETIVTAHGGKIQARNSTDGPGAEFYFTIPMEDKNGSEH